MPRVTPRVEGATLVNRTDAAQAVLVGTSAWYTWLDRATSFAFVGTSGSFTARIERRGGANGYWKACRKRAGVVRSVYLVRRLILPWSAYRVRRRLSPNRAFLLSRHA